MIRNWINRQIRNYVLRNKKLSADILAGINDRRARSKVQKLIAMDKNFKRRSYAKTMGFN